MIIQVQVTGLVVVHEQRILGLHCSGAELHAGQVAVIRHGPRLKRCDLYFSRKPCSTCLKMIINGKQPLFTQLLLPVCIDGLVKVLVKLVGFQQHVIIPEM